MAPRECIWFVKLKKVKGSIHLLTFTILYHMIGFAKRLETKILIILLNNRVLRISSKNQSTYISSVVEYHNLEGDSSAGMLCTMNACDIDIQTVNSGSRFYQKEDNIMLNKSRIRNIS